MIDDIGEIVRELQQWARDYSTDSDRDLFVRAAALIERLAAERENISRLNHARAGIIERSMEILGDVPGKTLVDRVEAVRAEITKLTSERDDLLKANQLLHGLVSNREASAEAAEARLRWRPIETAPRDEGVIVYADGIIGEASRPDATGRWWWAGQDESDTWAKEIFPTCWMPLPDAPTGEEG